MKYRDHYDTRLIEDNGVLIFQFTSRGVKEILKAIEFHPQFYEVYRRSVYSLIFGDYRNEAGRLQDFEISDNGDVYKVFHTVLSTIPLFFLYRPKTAILVQGSDSSRDFFRVCIHSCRKGCTHACKNEGRRIRIYRTFLDKYFVQLNEDYSFAGSIRSHERRHFYISSYEPGKAYDEIILFQK